MTGTFTVDHDGSPLTGTVDLDGGKHSFVQTLAGAALADSGRLLNCPDHVDAQTMRDLLALLFETVELNADATLTFAAPVRRTTVRIPESLSARSRSVFNLLPALLHHAGSVVLESSPTGCSIGDRPWDWYVEVLRQFGAETEDLPDGLYLRWSRPTPATIKFRYPTMTGSVIAIAAAAVCPGESVLENLSVEPTINDELSCLTLMGVGIRGELPALSISGRRDPEPADFEIGPDRIHAVSYLCAGLLTRGRVTVRASRELEIPRFIEVCGSMGAELVVTDTTVTVGFPVDREWLSPVKGVRCGSEPLFSSDWAATVALVACARSRGTSAFSDDVFVQRFQFVDTLPQMVARQRAGKLGGRAATHIEVDGPWQWSGGDRTVDPPSEIRGAVACVLAGLVAPGRWVVGSDRHINRGHTNLARDLRALGASITHHADGAA